MLLQIFKQERGGTLRPSKHGTVGSAALSDASLYEAIAERQAWALSALYDRYGTLLYSLAINIVKREQLAQEIVEKTFITVWHKSVALRQELRDHLGEWLILLCRAFAVSSYRLQNYLTATDVVVEKLAESMATLARGQFEALSPLKIGETLREVLRNLPELERTTIEMFFLKGMTIPEIASSSGLAVQEVQKQIQKVLRIMRERLSQFEEK